MIADANLAAEEARPRCPTGGERVRARRSRSALRDSLHLLQGPLDRTIAIEVSDFTGGTDLEELDAVVQSFEFGDPA